MASNPNRHEEDDLGELAATPPSAWCRHGLLLQVLAGMALGALVGWHTPHLGLAMKPLADGFLKLVQMLIGPIIFCTIVHGIANGGSLRMVGRVAVKSLLYFELVTTAALAIGFLGIDLLHPGTGLRLARSGDGAEGASGIAAKAAHSVGLAEFLLAIIPSSPLGGFLHNHILQILLFSVLFGIGLKQTGDIGAPVLAVVNGVARALSALIGMVMKLSPFAAFGALSYTAGEFGLATLFSLGKMVVEFYLACFLFNLPVLLLVSWLIRISLWRRIVFLGEELLLVFGTTSSEMVFLQLVEKQTFLGVEEPVGCRQRIVSTTEEPVSITPQRLYFWLRPPVHRRIRDDSALGSACF